MYQEPNLVHSWQPPSRTPSRRGSKAKISCIPGASLSGRPALRDTKSERHNNSVVRPKTQIIAGTGSIATTMRKPGE
jgi:hypothetical protein